MVIHLSNLKKPYAWWPVGFERKKAKLWAETQAYHEWHDEWYVVDGILILFYCKPHYYKDL